MTKGFVVYPTYRIIENKAYVYLFGRLENGESFLTINHCKPYFFIKADDQKKAEHFLEKNRTDTEIAAMGAQFEKTKLKNFDDEQAVKVILTIPKQVPILRKHLEELKIICYEADIRFAQRFLMDHDVKGLLTITGHFKKGNYVDRIYEEPEISGATTADVSLKTLSFDIETNMGGTKIFSIAYVCDKKKQVLLCTDKNIDGEHITPFADEKNMLEAFLAAVQKEDPDIITGWNIITFDLDMLRRKCKAYNIPFVLGRAEWESSLKIYHDFFRDSTADIAGRQVLDGIALLKDNFIKLDDYKLDTAAAAFAGEKKTIQFTNKGAEIEDLALHHPKKLAEYNLKDAELVLMILKNQNLISITMQRSLLTGMNMERVSASIASFDSLYIRAMTKRGYVCPTAGNLEREERIKGGFVMDSVPGIYDYVIVCDFKSLYPSIIRTFNIDPLSFHHGGQLKAPNGANFADDAGLLPLLIQELWEMRDQAKRKKDNVASYAIKITMNSFFGILANPRCRFYSLDMANAITSWGREIVQDTAKKVERESHKVIYSDTDSIFVALTVSSYTEAEKIGLEIQASVNQAYTQEIKKTYQRTSFLELEFEKVYKRFIMPMIRGSTEGAKKRYAGLLVDNTGKEKMDIVGLEFVRSDWTALAKEFQMELLSRVFHKKEVFAYIKSVVDDVRNGKVDDKLVYRKSISKDLKEYVKTTPPHVKAARKLGKIESNVISYVMTVEGPEPVQKIEHKLDYDHYLDKQLKPIADTILVFFHQKFEDIITGNKQKNLFEY